MRQVKFLGASESIMHPVAVAELESAFSYHGWYEGDIHWLSIDSLKSTGTQDRGPLVVYLREQGIKDDEAFLVTIFD